MRSLIVLIFAFLFASHVAFSSVEVVNLIDSETMQSLELEDVSEGSTLLLELSTGEVKTFGYCFKCSNDC